MTVENQVLKACRSVADGDFEGALHDICSAIEATCKLVYGKGGKTTYKAFIKENLPYITHFGFGGVTIENLFLSYTHPEVPTSPSGQCSIEDLVYHVVRCGLYHEAALPPNIEFANGQLQCRVDGTLVLPSGLIMGLILSVILNPVHSQVTTQSQLALTIDNCNIAIDKLWGKRDELRRLWDALAPFR